jgi:hypothetical protein
MVHDVMSSRQGALFAINGSVSMAYSKESIL